MFAAGHQVVIFFGACLQFRAGELTNENKNEKEDENENEKANENEKENENGRGAARAVRRLMGVMRGGV